MKSIAQLLLEYHCNEIANCPGRYVVRSIPENLSISELLSNEVEVSYYNSPRARDQIAVVALEDGGIISYIRSNGTILHTINNKSGFSRKLNDLGIIYRQRHD